MALSVRPPGPRLSELRNFVAAQQYTVAVQIGKSAACHNFRQPAAMAFFQR
jgi:hypothetical protein